VETEEEIWKLIPGYTKYEASSFGRFRSLHFFDRPSSSGPKNFRNGEKVIMKQTMATKYLSVMFCEEGVRKRLISHRLIALTFIENPHNKGYVHHKDSNRLNNHISNLEWVTQSENIKHAYDQNRMNTKRSKKVINTETGKIFNSAILANQSLENPFCKKYFQKLMRTPCINLTPFKWYTPEEDENISA